MIHTPQEITKLAIIEAVRQLGIKDKETLLLCIKFHDIYESTYYEIECLDIDFESALAGYDDLC